MQIGKKKIRSHCSVITNIERKMKALESRFVWMLKVHLSHSDLCHMGFAWCRNGWMQIWGKTVRIHRSVNTSVERKMKALQSPFVWMRPDDCSVWNSFRKNVLWHNSICAGSRNVLWHKSIWTRSMFKAETSSGTILFGPECLGVRNINQASRAKPLRA